jgi:hypothetical protein
MYLPLIRTDNSDQNQPLVLVLPANFDFSLSVSSVFISGKNYFLGKALSINGAAAR